ncbi:MHS family MFS transporter [Gordonia sp. TBRC 11910]|uniref:MHS family MFS transporter n=1 Tax=Gordonia asplenii TaxID=2725283 RepID=A0A848KY13_9ACTN|nr:MFS transporter [Gordonia asplenii]NMO03007.1 MHS family MFS transporter [Gordonia asplenii]
MTMTNSDVESPTYDGDSAKAKQAAKAAFFGSMLEYYDFYIFASAAALVFPTVFFAGSKNPLMLSLATFGISYVARPIGAFVLGHFGDRAGRKRVMMFCLVLMGVVTFAVGCLPSREAMGWVGPALLILLRVGQGISAAGEQSGAGSLTLEHSPMARRGFFCSWTLTGTQAGFIVASLAFIPVAAMPDHLLYTWGWRIPFWCSFLVLVVAYVVRRKLEEPEIFIANTADDAEKAEPMPFVTLFRYHWRDVLRVIVCAFIAVVSTVFAVFGLAFATSPEVGISRTTMLWVAIAANAVALVSQPLYGALSDRIGRKPVFIGGALTAAVGVFAYFGAIGTGNVGAIFAAAIVLMAGFYGATNAVWPVFYAEMFSSKVRYSGMAIGTQIGFALAGFAPTIATALRGDDVKNWLPVAIFTACCTLLAAASAATAPERFKTTLDELDNREIAAHR